MDPSAALTGCAPPIEGETEHLALLRSLELLDTAAEPAPGQGSVFTLHLQGC